MRVQQAPADDVLVGDGQVVVIIDGTLVLLSEISTFIYAICGKPKDLDEVIMALEAKFGSPPGSSTRDATRVPSTNC